MGTWRRKKMKEALKKIGKKYKWKFLIQIVFIIINIYLLTIPATMIGKMIDYMYDISANRTQIMMCVYSLMGISFALLVIRVIWKFFDTYLPRSVEMELKNVLFSQLLKLKIYEIQNKKNGELMSYFVKDVSEIRVCTARIFCVCNDCKCRFKVNNDNINSHCDNSIFGCKNKGVFGKKFSKGTKHFYGIIRVYTRKYRCD